MTTYAGVDGCRGGWIVVSRVGDGPPNAAVHLTFDGLVSSLPDNAIFAVDMPIGLPDRIDSGGRGPEQAVRRFLGPRQSSVFAMPSRTAVYAEPGPFTGWEAMRAGRKRADAVARQTSFPSRGLAFQSFTLFPKIREIDALLRRDMALVSRVIESHPEAAFAVLNGGTPMTLPKKAKGVVNPAGMAERRALLVGLGFPPAFVVADPPRGAGADDFLDACALMLVAARYARGEARSHPPSPARDRFGLPIAIWT